MDARCIFVSALLLVACKPPPGVGTTPSPTEPSVIVENPGTAPVCDLVEQHDASFAIQEHDDWLDLWLDRELGPPEQITELGSDAREALCRMAYDSSGGVLECEETGRLVLSMPTDFETVILIVEPTEQGLRSIEVSRWQHTCRCDCGSSIEVLDEDPLSVVVFEYEDVASEIHFEGDEVVEGCEEDDECQTACIGESYGSQRLLVFDDSLGVREAFVDYEVQVGGLSDVRFALDRDGRLVAIDQCTQVLAD